MLLDLLRTQLLVSSMQHVVTAERVVTLFEICVAPRCMLRWRRTYVRERECLHECVGVRERVHECVSEGVLG